MIIAAWQLGGGQLTAGLHPSRLCRWAHQLGHGGHFLTKSRRYSVTFGRLRATAPTTAMPSATPPGSSTPGAAPWTSAWSSSSSTWTYAGTGANTPTPGAELALASADRPANSPRPPRDLIPSPERQ